MNLQTPTLRVALLLVVGTFLATGPAVANHTPTPWPTVDCTGSPPFENCWTTIPSLDAAVLDKIASNGDQSSKSNPAPKSADLSSGLSGTDPTFYYAYDPVTEVLFFRMRLNDTPTLAVQGGNSPPTSSNSGPFSSNTAWNFVLDLDGDGWADFAATTDGNTGKQQDPYDTIRLAYVDTPGSQVISNTDDCNAGGQVLFLHKAVELMMNGTAIQGCANQGSAVCDWGFTRVVNNNIATEPDRNFFLDMQFPLETFDTCSGADTDGDGFGGAQLLNPDSHFSLCVTTSTQPNDFTNKDLAYADPYAMANDKRLPCSDGCTLTGGCSATPTVQQVEAIGCNPVTLRTEILDTLVSTDGTTVTDTISSVEFAVREAGTFAYTTVGTAVAPDAGTVNRWSTDWANPATGNYWVRITALDDQGNQVDTDNAEQLLGIDTGNSCTTFATPVSLASFEATAAPGAGTRIEWTTDTEAGTVGFQLFRQRPDGTLEKVGGMVPSVSGDSVTPSTYVAELPSAVGSGPFYLQDLDVFGQGDLHGPFESGRLHGRRAEAPGIDWRPIARAADASRKAWWVEATAGVIGTVARARDGVGGVGTKAQAAAGPVARLLVTEDGIHRVTYDDLLAAGIDLTGIPASEIAVTVSGTPVPRLVVGATRSRGRGVPAAGTFRPGSYLEFWGTGLDTLYTDTNVYRLELDRSKAVDADVDSRAPARKGEVVAVHRQVDRTEEQTSYSFASPVDDPWYMRRMLAFRSPVSFELPLEMDGDALPGAQARLTVDLWGGTDFPADPDHHVVVSVNGVEVADLLFDGSEAPTVDVDLPPGLLSLGANSLTIELPGDTGVAYDLVNLESYALAYDRRTVARDGRLDFQAAGDVLAVSGLGLPPEDVVAYRLDGSRPTRLSGLGGDAGTVTLRGTSEAARYWVGAAATVARPEIEPARPAADLAASADLLIVSHPDFLDGIERLADARRAQGLDVSVVDTEDLYDRYTGGVFDPQAIRAHVARVVPRWLLLVGADTTDARGFGGTGSLSFVPTLYTPTDGIVRYAPADSLFGDLDGDGVQDVAVGRLPVRTPAELEIVVDKTLAYGAKTYGGQGVYAADVVDPAGPYSFVISSEASVEQLPAGWSVRRAYADHLGVAGTRAAIRQGIEDGAALVSFFGHSGLGVWGFRNLFNVRDVQALDNSGKPTVVTQWGCWNTYYVSPNTLTMGHQLMIAGRQGAAAVLGASTLTQAVNEERLGALLTPRLTAPGVTVGEAIVDAKREMAQRHPGALDVLLGWTLLGDPTLEVGD